MTIPTPPSSRRRDYYHFPEIGEKVRIRGLVSTTYLQRGETMIISWTQFWEEFVLRNYVDILGMVEEPSANEYFPTMAEIWELISLGAQTLPGEKILGMRASGNLSLIHI